MLSLLQERIRARRANDKSPISADLAPAEIVPLIAAMNSLLQRLAATNETQRRFVANAAHQLKTPLAGMRTQADLALRERRPDKLNASLEQMVLGSERKSVVKGKSGDGRVDIGGRRRVKKKKTKQQEQKSITY